MSARPQPSASSSEVHVSIRLTDGPPRTYSVPAASTVLDLKRRIAETWEPGLPRVDGQRLVRMGRVLQDGRVLGEELGETRPDAPATLHLVVQPEAWTQPVPRSSPAPGAARPSNILLPTPILPNPLPILSSGTGSTSHRSSRSSAGPPPLVLSPSHPLHTFAHHLSTLSPAALPNAYASLVRLQTFYAGRAERALAVLRGEGEWEPAWKEAEKAVLEWEESVGVLGGLQMERAEREGEEMVYEVEEIDNQPQLRLVPSTWATPSSRLRATRALAASLAHQPILAEMQTLLQHTSQIRILASLSSPTSSSSSSGTGSASSSSRRRTAAATAALAPLLAGLHGHGAGQGAAGAQDGQARRPASILVINLSSLLQIAVPLLFLSLKLAFMLWIFCRHADWQRRILLGTLAVAYVVWEGWGMIRIQRRQINIGGPANPAAPAPPAPAPAAAVPAPPQPQPAQQQQQQPAAGPFGPPPAHPPLAARAPPREPGFSAVLDFLAHLNLSHEAALLGLPPPVPSSAPLPPFPPAPLPRSAGPPPRQSWLWQKVGLPLLLIVALLLPEVERRRGRALRWREGALREWERRAREERERWEREKEEAAERERNGAAAQEKAEEAPVPAPTPTPTVPAPPPRTPPELRDTARDYFRRVVDDEGRADAWAELDG